MKEKNKIWKPTLKNWMGKLGFNFDGMFITDPFITPCETESVDDPKIFYGLSDDQLKQFDHMKGEIKNKPLTEDPSVSYKRAVNFLKRKVKKI